MKTWVERFPSRGNSKCKGSEVETSLMAFQSVLSLFQKHSVCSCAKLGSKPGFATYLSDDLDWITDITSLGFSLRLLGGISEMLKVNIFSKQKMSILEQKSR